MKTALNLAAEKLGKDDEYLQALTQGKDIESSVDAVVDGTKLYDVAARKALVDGGEAAVAASTDPMIVAARRLIRWRASINAGRWTKMESVLTPAGEKTRQGSLPCLWKRRYIPMRPLPCGLSYGTVKGYPYNGTVAPPFTTFYGLYDRAASFSNQPPFDLTPKEVARRDKLDLATPFDFVSTGDIIGGNSGSPVVNREGELVGLIFDGNIESLAGDFVYDGRQNRAVAVHSAGMIEGLRKLYGADLWPTNWKAKSS